MQQQPDLHPQQVPDLQSRPLGDDLLIYAPEQGVVHILNRTARLIWEACDGTQTPLTIERRLKELFAVSGRHLPADDVARTLHELHRLCLITWAKP